MANVHKSYSAFSGLLEKKKISSYRVAKDLGFSPMALSDWKNNRSKPNMNKMLKIAEYLDVPVESFDCDEE